MEYEIVKNDIIKFRFGTAVSFTVEETLRKLQKEYRLKWEMVIDDACHHFEYELSKLADQFGLKMFGDFKKIRIDKPINLKNSFYKSRIFLNIGPGQIVSPVEMKVSDVIISHRLENYFFSNGSTVLFYKELRTDV